MMEIMNSDNCAKCLKQEADHWLVAAFEKSGRFLNRSREDRIVNRDSRFVTFSVQVGAVHRTAFGVGETSTEAIESPP